MSIKQKASMFVEQGTVLTLIPVANRALQRRRALGQSRNKDLFILSGNDSDHSMESRHYDNGAWDEAKSDFTYDEIYKAVNRVSVADEIYVQEFCAPSIIEYKLVKVTHYFDVVPYSWGFHIEYDPKHLMG